MRRRLVVDIPPVVCIGGCGATADATVSYVDCCDRYGASQSPSVQLQPPRGWMSLQCDRPGEGQIQRMFAICASCYQRGHEYGRISTTAAIEVAPPAPVESPTCINVSAIGTRCLRCNGHSGNHIGQRSDGVHVGWAP